MTVLVLTSREDVAADMVVHQLNRDGIPVLRIDPADYPGRVSLVSTLSHGILAGSLIQDSRSTELASIRSVWVRRPGTPNIDHREQREWLNHEANHAFYGALYALKARWMNPPEVLFMARYKLRQLRLAEEAGLITPQTLVTDIPEEAETFTDRHGRTVCKTISGRQPDGQIYLPTTQIGPDVEFSGLEGNPSCFQRGIEKVADVRLTVVEDQMFTAIARCGESDVRFEDGVQWNEVVTPPHIRASVQRLMKRLGCVYGALDFAVDAFGCWWFLECNPAGQFGFIEIATGLPISRAISDYLAAPAA